MVIITHVMIIIIFIIIMITAINIIVKNLSTLTKVSWGTSWTRSRAQVPLTYRSLLVSDQNLDHQCYHPTRFNMKWWSRWSGQIFFLIFFKITNVSNDSWIFKLFSWHDIAGGKRRSLKSKAGLHICTFFSYTYH